MGGIAVFVVLAGLAGFYVFRSYKKMGAQGIANHYGLAPGEAAQYMWLGELDVDISLAQRAATAAAGLVAGALLGGIGIATTRALGVTVLLTTHRRLVLITEQVDGKVGRLYVDHPSQIAIRFLGPGQRRVQGGPSVRVQLVGPDGVPCDMILHETAQPYLQQWLANVA